VDAPYEEPLAPEVRLPTAEALAERVVEELRARDIIAG
jgi:adenylylsulfate kinase-like enzyme